LEADLTKYVEQMEVAFITGDPSFANWDEYIKTLEKMGYKEVQDIYQVAYDRWEK